MTAPSSINLTERFGGDYRITFEEGYAHRGKHRDNLDPWYMQIPARFGTIYPYGRNTLGVMIDNHRYVAKKLAGLACCQLVQDGNLEKTFLFDVDHFPAVAAILLPHRKPQLTEDQRQASRERMLALRAVKIPCASGEN